MKMIWTAHNRHIKPKANELLQVWEIESGYLQVKIKEKIIGVVKKLRGGKHVKKGWYATEDSWYMTRPTHPQFKNHAEGPFETRDEAIDALLVKQPKDLNLKTVEQVRAILAVARAKTAQSLASRPARKPPVAHRGQTAGGAMGG
jgi:hypothetical protein